jgi:hypothetical protein
MTAETLGLPEALEPPPTDFALAPPAPPAVIEEPPTDALPSPAAAETGFDMVAVEPVVSAADAPPAEPAVPETGFDLVPVEPVVSATEAPPAEPTPAETGFDVGAVEPAAEAPPTSSVPESTDSSGVGAAAGAVEPDEPPAVVVELDLSGVTTADRSEDETTTEEKATQAPGEVTSIRSADDSGAAPMEPAAEPAVAETPPESGLPVAAGGAPAMSVEPALFAEEEAAFEAAPTAPDPATTLKVARVEEHPAPEVVEAPVPEFPAEIEPPPAAASVAEEPAPPAEPPAEILAAVDRFNRRHQVVFEGLRREIGAGARNFVLTCMRRLGAGGAAFEGFTPDKTGAFDREAIARRLAELSPEDPHAALEALIGLELSLVRDLIEPARLQNIEHALGEV